MARIKSFDIADADYDEAVAWLDTRAALRRDEHPDWGEDEIEASRTSWKERIIGSVVAMVERKGGRKK